MGDSSPPKPPASAHKRNRADDSSAAVLPCDSPSGDDNVDFVAKKPRDEGSILQNSVSAGSFFG
jgi:hypothetical protein